MEQKLPNSKDAPKKSPQTGLKKGTSLKKRLIAAILAMVLILGGLGTFLIVRHVRNNRPPALDTIRARVETLINASHEVNEIFWGDGLPTYPRVYEEYLTRHPFYLVKVGRDYVVSDTETDIRLLYYVIEDAEQGEIIAYQYCFSQAKDGDPQNIVYIDVQSGDETTSKEWGKVRYARKSTTPEATEPLYEKSGVYYYPTTYTEPEFKYTAADPEYYDYVRFDCKYGTIAEIKNKAEQIYAKDFLDSVYESLFTGIAIGGTNGVLYARYMDYTDSEGNGFLMKSNTYEGASVARTYLFDTMRMSEKRKSNAKDVFVDIDTYVPGKESEVVTITVGLTLQGGLWYLNSPTY